MFLAFIHFSFYFCDLTWTHCGNLQVLELCGLPGGAEKGRKGRGRAGRGLGLPNTKMRPLRPTATMDILAQPCPEFNKVTLTEECKLWNLALLRTLAGISFLSKASLEKDFAQPAMSRPKEDCGGTHSLGTGVKAQNPNRSEGFPLQANSEAANSYCMLLHTIALVHLRSFELVNASQDNTESKTWPKAGHGPSSSLWTFAVCSP